MTVGVDPDPASGTDYRVAVVRLQEEVIQLKGKLDKAEGLLDERHGDLLWYGDIDWDIDRTAVQAQGGNPSSALSVVSQKVLRLTYKKRFAEQYNILKVWISVEPIFLKEANLLGGRPTSKNSPVRDDGGQSGEPGYFEGGFSETFRTP